MGVSEFDFWDMTVAEIQRAADAYNWQKTQELKQKAQFVYLLPQLIGSSVGRLFDRNATYPKIYEVFPELFNEEMEYDRKMELSAARFIQFANNFNKKYEVK